MLSPLELEILGNLSKEIRRLNLNAKKYAGIMEKISDAFSCDQQAQEKPTLFSEDEVERLMTLNRRLREIEAFNRDIAREFWPVLMDKIKNQNDRIGDFEIDTKIHYILRDDDPEARKDSDNILTTRDDILSCQMDKPFEADMDEPIEADRVDYREWNGDNTDQLAAEPHCYLFHSLIEHGNSMEQPNVPLRDCLRIGTIWIDVIVVQQYFLDVETGKWSKSDGKLAERYPNGSN